MDEKKVKAIMNFSTAMEQMIVDISVGMREEHGIDVATSVLINVATTMLAEVMVMAPEASRQLIAEAIEHEITIKIGEAKAVREVDKAVDTVITRAKAGQMTCYPDKPTKH
jgi:hypothetical protein